MQGNDKVIQHLNKILYNELRAINQYFLHSRMLSDWGFNKFAEYEYGESMDEMKHADQLIPVSYTHLTLPTMDSV